MKSKEKHIAERTHLRPLRWFVIRLLACCTVCLPLLIIELGLRWVGPDPGSVLKDPLVSFGDLSPLFVLNESGTAFETVVERHFYFCPQSFSAVKGQDTFRIFCLGGSTVQGRPYSVETSFSTWLKLNLEGLSPDRPIEMVNCGGFSYASYRLIPIMDELLTYEPDLIILCTGQNEFLEERTYRRLKQVPQPLIGLHHQLLRLWAYKWSYKWMTSRRNRHAVTTVLPEEVKPKLDLEAGLETYHRDDELRHSIVQQFGHNLEVLVQRAQEANVPLILMNPVSNLIDCPPFKSEPSTNLSPEEQTWMQGLLTQANQSDNQWIRLGLLEQAVKLEDQHAGLLYQLGTCYVSLGQFDKAKATFITAKEQDICPLRMLESMHEAIKDTATRYGLPLVDIRDMIEQKSEHGIPGDQWLVDHVHPSINGHQMIADALTDLLVEKHRLNYPEQWESQKKTHWQTHLMSLDEGYYQEGFEHLMMLKTWIRERAGIKGLE